MSEPILALDEIPKASLFRRVMHRVRQLINYPESLAGYRVSSDVREDNPDKREK
jgi:hypothetical protein